MALMCAESSEVAAHAHLQGYIAQREPHPPRTYLSPIYAPPPTRKPWPSPPPRKWGGRFLMSEVPLHAHLGTGARSAETPEKEGEREEST